MRFMSRIYRNIARHVADYAAGDLSLAMRMEARDSSARFLSAQASQASQVASREEVLETALRAIVGRKGCICEFGVYQGYTLRLLAKGAPDRTVYGFDSFEGLPEHWRAGYAAGTFETRVPAFTEPNIRIVKGRFEQTLESFLDGLQEDISLVHIDCDLYSSTKTILRLVTPRLAPGAILVFDEYMNYPGWQEHEHRALSEAMEQGLLVRYDCFNAKGEQLMVSVASNPSWPAPDMAAK